MHEVSFLHPLQLPRPILVSILLHHPSPIPTVTPEVRKQRREYSKQHRARAHTHSEAAPQHMHHETWPHQRPHPSTSNLRTASTVLEEPCHQLLLQLHKPYCSSHPAAARDPTAAGDATKQTAVVACQHDYCCNAVSLTGLGAAAAQHTKPATALAA